MREQELQNNIRVELSKLGFVVFRMNVGSFYTKDGRYIPSSLPKGFSDLLALKDGKVYFLEVKVGKNKASPEQLNFIEQMKKRGCKAGVVYSVEDAIKICE